MPDPDYFLKRGDSGVTITDTLKNAAGVAVDITGATVRFHMVPIEGGALKVNAVATIDNAAGGQVSYAWLAADTNTAGWFVAEWEVTFAGGAVQTYPNDSHILVNIHPELVA